MCFMKKQLHCVSMQCNMIDAHLHMPTNYQHPIEKQRLKNSQESFIELITHTDREFNLGTLTKSNNLYNLLCNAYVCMICFCTDFVDGPCRKGLINYLITVDSSKGDERSQLST